MQTYKIAAIPADGIGPEVIAAGLQVLETLERRDGTFKLDVTHFDWGSDHYKRTGLMMPADGIARLRPFDAIFSAPWVRRTFPTTSRSEGCDYRSAKASTSTRTFGPPRSCRASSRRSRVSVPAISTG